MSLLGEFYPIGVEDEAVAVRVLTIDLDHGVVLASVRLQERVDRFPTRAERRGVGSMEASGSDSGEILHISTMAEEVIAGHTNSD